MSSAKLAPCEGINFRRGCVNSQLLNLNILISVAITVFNRISYTNKDIKGIKYLFLLILFNYPKNNNSFLKRGLGLYPDHPSPDPPLHVEGEII